ncbi:MAG: hypothetical protein WCD07_06600 [Burkholderiales bacterium]
MLPQPYQSYLYNQVISTAPLQGQYAWLHALIIVLTLALGLVIDRLGGIAGQIVVSVTVWSLLLYLLSLQIPVWRITLIFAMALVFAFECLLSLVFGWYDYHFLNIPPFVPPGHILLFMLGATLAPRVPDVATLITPIAVALYGTFAAISGWSTFDSALAIIFLITYRYGSSHKTFTIMLLLALGLELWGTWLGNWTWRPVTPFTGGLTTHNPPLLAGAVYACFDMCVMVIARKVHRHQDYVPEQIYFAQSA